MVEAEDSGAYRVTFELPERAEITVGRFGRFRFEPGRYIYIGSAKRALSKRVARHHRLATEKSGNLRWHIDYLLTHPQTRLLRIERFVDGDECTLSARMARRRGVTVPVPGLGASDCRSGCASHLYRLPD